MLKKRVKKVKVKNGVIGDKATKNVFTWHRKRRRNGAFKG